MTTPNSFFYLPLFDLQRIFIYLPLVYPIHIKYHLSFLFLSQPNHFILFPRFFFFFNCIFSNNPVSQQSRLFSLFLSLIYFQNNHEFSIILYNYLLSSPSPSLRSPFHLIFATKAPKNTDPFSNSIE